MKVGFPYYPCVPVSFFLTPPSTCRLPFLLDPPPPIVDILLLSFDFLVGRVPPQDSFHPWRFNTSDISYGKVRPFSPPSALRSSPLPPLAPFLLFPPFQTPPPSSRCPPDRGLPIPLISPCKSTCRPPPPPPPKTFHFQQSKPALPWNLPSPPQTSGRPPTRPLPDVIFLFYTLINPPLLPLIP